MKDEAAMIRSRKILKAYEQVAEQIKDEIMSGRVKPGEKLPTEEELAKRFGVGRPTIREALRLLESVNLIDSSRGPTGGTFIRQPSHEGLIDLIRDSVTLLVGTRSVELSDLLDTREFIEVPCAELAALKRSEADLTRMKEHLLSTEFKKLTPVEVRVADAYFHQAVVSATGNPLLEIFVEAIHSVYQGFLRRWSLPDDFLSNVISQHRDIYDAIRGGKPVEARAAMQKHISYLKELLPRLKAALDEQMMD